ncbi:MAG: NAD(P)/FAD-dependent oxidoreductase [Dokdonella sp.]|uniref:NAD(P)/FAD-dependent oxidoreductase n=1 Tax=Dokdonella sp. TaxID=2291710 RepID=UPI0025B8D16A|nr:FAD/NAD(P)-binding oxidoreductase [Dokdonella sp.]MBZ0221939.1 NAD(P)/FAD-dependent oxidoreductase [Dokdonella sp.]MCC7255642.1 NAD(P)/FAD-dependent oxidoreductase [Dokdonella sp.]
MAKIVVMGAGLGGMSAAFELRETLGKAHEIVLIGQGDRFSFTPSNPWLAVGWRKSEDITLDVAEHAERKDIRFIADGVERIEAGADTVITGVGERIGYDYLLICTGPKLAFEDVPGSGPEIGHTQSVCTTPHAAQAWQTYQAFLADPGPVVIGAVQGASCFGPAYEFAMIVDADLRKRKLRDKVPMTFVSSEPYVGHMGLGGVGDSRGLMEAEMRQRHIHWVVNSKVTQVREGEIDVLEHDAKGHAGETRTLPFKFAMLLPAFKGVDAVAAVEGLCNPRGFVIVDKHQRSLKYPKIFSAGVCVAIPPVEATPVPTGAPKTGFMIESMVTTIVRNIQAELAGKKPDFEGTWNAVCLADMGDTGAAFVALPQIPPRNVTWTKIGRWVHVAKVAFEKYFLYKMRHGTSEPVYEKYILSALGIERLKDTRH